MARAVIAFLVVFAACRDQPDPLPHPVDSVAVKTDTMRPGLRIDTLTAFIFPPPAAQDDYGLAASIEFRDNLSAITDSLKAIGFVVVVADDTVRVGTTDRTVYVPCAAWQGCIAVYLVNPARSLWPDTWFGHFTVAALMPAARNALKDALALDGPWDWGEWRKPNDIEFIAPDVDSYTRDHFDKSVGEGWFALSGDALRRVAVTVDSVELDCSELEEAMGDTTPKPPGQLYGRRLRLRPDGGYYALIRNAPGLKEGAVPSARRISVDSGNVREGPIDYLPRKVLYDFRGEQVALVRLPNDFIELRQRGQRFPLMRWGPFDEGRWNTELDWIGDLNGDGVLDAILDVSPKYTVEHWFWFFLSDPAHPERGPQLVDRFSDFGCGHI